MNPDASSALSRLDGPLDREAFFARRSPAASLPASPRLAFGTAWLATRTQDDAVEEAVATLHEAWDSGFLLTDTARKYGRAEEFVGRALQSCAGARPIICTKFGDEGGRQDYTPPGLARQLDESRATFGGRDPDFVAVHEPELCPDGERDGCIQYVHELVESGRLAGAGLGGGGPVVQRRWIEQGAFSYVITYHRISAVTLQGLSDTVPLARRHGALLVAASPLYSGLLGSRHDELLAERPAHIPPSHLDRAAELRKLAGQAGIALSQLALRLVLSVSAVDYVLAGASDREEWRDCVKAYEAGPLDSDLFAAVVRIAQTGEEPQTGG